MDYTADGDIDSDSELLDDLRLLVSGPVQESQEGLNSTTESDEPPVLLPSHTTGMHALG